MTSSYPLVWVTPELLGITIEVNRVKRKLLLDSLRSGIRLSRDKTIDPYQPSNLSAWCDNPVVCPERRHINSQPWKCGALTPHPFAGYSAGNPFCTGDECTLKVESHFEGFEDMSLSPGQPSQIRPVKMTQTIEGRVDADMSSIDGVFGLAANGCRDGEPGDQSEAFGVSLRKAEIESGEIETIAEKVQSGNPTLTWSESTRQSGPDMDGLWTGILHDLSINQINLLSPTSRHWTFAISLETDCLRLPPFLYYRFVRNLPVLQLPTDVAIPSMPASMWNQSVNIGNEKSYLPIVDKDALGHMAVSFRLKSQRDSRKFKVPLTHLLKSDQKSLCVTPAREAIQFGEIGITQFYDTKTPMIILGQKVLRDIPFVWNRENQSIGFTQVSINEELFEGMELNQCGLNRVWMAAERRCLPVNCSAFSFLVPSGSTGMNVCQFQPTFTHNLSLAGLAVALLTSLAVSYRALLMRKAIRIHTQKD